MRYPKGYRVWINIQLDWRLILALSVFLYILLHREWDAAGNAVIFSGSHSVDLRRFGVKVKVHRSGFTFPIPQ